MSHAAAAAIAWYFSQTDADLLSKHFPDNTGSRAVLLKVGFANPMLGHVLQASTEKGTFATHGVVRDCVANNAIQSNN